MENPIEPEQIYNTTEYQTFLTEHLANVTWGFFSDFDDEFILSVKNFLISGNHNGKTPFGIWTLKGVDGIVKEEKLFIR